MTSNSVYEIQCRSCKINCSQSYQRSYRWIVELVDKPTDNIFGCWNKAEIEELAPDLTFRGLWTKEKHLTIVWSEFMSCFPSFFFQNIMSKHFIHRPEWAIFYQLLKTIFSTFLNPSHMCPFLIIYHSYRTWVHLVTIWKSIYKIEFGRNNNPL